MLRLTAIRPLPLELCGARLNAAAVVLGGAGLLPGNPVDLVLR